MSDSSDPYEADWQKIARRPAGWQKAARAQADWQKVARTDAMKLWTRRVRSPDPPPVAFALGLRSDNRLPVGLDEKARCEHVYIVGTSGYGKSTLLLNLIKQDIEQGRGFAVLDPHGDLADKILRLIPENRISDTIYYDPADVTRPIALNPLQTRTYHEQQRVLGNFMVLFQRLFPSATEAPRLLYILRYAMATLMESGNKTLLDLHRLLTDDDYRNRVVADIRNPVLLDYWKPKGHFETRHKKQTDSILNKLAEFDLDPIIRNTLGRPESKVDFYDAMQTSKMFIANLSEGTIGQENTSLLGSVLTSMIQLAAVRRTGLSDAARPVFTLYIDEFQNFIVRAGNAFEKIRNEARKNRLSLVLAHQSPSQLPRDLRIAIASVESMITFRLGVEDARVLQDAFPSGTSERTIHRLQNLPRYQALVRVGPAQNNFLIETHPPPELPSIQCRGAIIEYSRKHYGAYAAKAEQPVDVTSPADKREPEPPRQSANPSPPGTENEPEPPPMEAWG